MKKQLKNDSIVKVFLFLFSVLFCIPSLIYLIQNKTVLNFSGNLEYCFLLTDKVDRLYQAGVYTFIILGFIFFYYLILKYRNRIFKNIKSVFIFVLIISSIFIFVIPFTSSDIFYYMGVGRLEATYHQNSYYTDIKSYVETNNIDLNNDTLIQKAYANVWSKTTVVYGAVWTLISSKLSIFSFGNVDIGLFIFKLAGLSVHMGSCYLLYKISNKKIFSLIYGLNPFILIEGIANVHNDLYVVFFMLCAIYMLTKKKKIVPALLFLALATDIKYFSVLLLPLFVLYHYKDRDIKVRIIKCIEYGILFIIMAAVPYLIYIQDMDVFMGLLVQRERIAKGLYLFISQYFNNPPNIVAIIKNASLLIFAILYIFKCIRLLTTKQIKFYKEMRELLIYMIAFLFLLITNFQPWYLMWLTPFIIWQKSENIKLITQMQILTLFANIVFLVYSENFVYGVPFFVILVFGIMICMIINKSKRTII